MKGTRREREISREAPRERHSREAPRETSAEKRRERDIAEKRRERDISREEPRETSAEKRRERDISRDVCVRGILNVCVRGSTCMRQVGGDHAPGKVGSIHQFSVGYTLHAFVERITLSHRAYMQFHNQERLLISFVRSA